MKRPTVDDVEIGSQGECETGNGKNSPATLPRNSDPAEDLLTSPPKPLVRQGRRPVALKRRLSEHKTRIGESQDAAGLLSGVPEKRRDWPQCDDIENQLRHFDLELKYGPCIGITRLERYDRAVKLGLNPEPEVRELLLQLAPESSSQLSIFSQKLK